MLYWPLRLVDTLVSAFVFILIGRIVLEWLLYLEIANPFNRQVVLLKRAFFGVTEPVLTPVRRLTSRLLPRLPIDLSPIILVIGLELATTLVWRITAGLGLI
jgi:YggT family protein